MMIEELDDPTGAGGLEKGSWDIDRMCTALDPLAIADAAAMSISIAQELETWVRSTALPVRQEQIMPAAILAAFIAPWLPSDQCSLFAQAILWTALIDVFVDDLKSESDRAVEACLQDCRSVISIKNADPTHSLSLALSTIHERFLNQPAGPSLYSFFQSATDSFLSGQSFERRAARALTGGAELPTIQEYLKQGARSIGMHFVTAVLWSTIESADASPAATSLGDALDDAALAVRLANDLAGHDRETVEGSVNALALGLQPDHVAHLLSQCAHRCVEKLNNFPPAGHLLTLALERQLLCYLRIYQRIDASH
ncbi:terpene synthase family protein [Streptomyces sp. NBC_01017]|uniref:terpene synthase family protein n=1 Tax=Streptomyces sp. NBC_01017 TaxID=2903721 RepID=UPI0038693CEB|nr:terpene synthase family protein [Streptomyces sp. NBC_01017]WSV35096.1 terpene synthase family protein [Streptomyces sp. NBC_01017]